MIVYMTGSETGLWYRTCVQSVGSSYTMCLCLYSIKFHIYVKKSVNPIIISVCTEEKCDVLFLSAQL
jgi:hypothetical protein